MTKPLTPIQRFLQIDDETETVLAQLPIRISCNSYWPNQEPVHGTLIYTNRRTGIFDDENIGFYYNSTMMIRNCRFYEEVNEMFLSFPNEDEPDDEFFIQADNVDTLFEIYESIHKLRIEYPLPIISERLEEAFILIQQRSFEKALPILEELRQADPIYGGIDLMLVRTLNVLGKSSQAVSQLAQQANYLIYWEPESLLLEYIWYPWHEGTLRYLPKFEETNEPSVDKMMLGMIIARAEGRVEDFVESITQVFLSLGKQDPSLYFRAIGPIFHIIELAQQLNYPSVLRLLNSMKEMIEQNVEDTTKKQLLLNYVEVAGSPVSKADSFHFATLAEQMLELYEQSEETSFAFNAEYLLVKEEFKRLSQLVSENTLLSNIAPQEWSTTEWLNLTEFWNEGEPAARLEIDIRVLFARWRLGQATPEQTLKYLQQWVTPELLKRLNERELTASRAVFLYYNLQVECRLSLGEYRDALTWLVRWQKESSLSLQCRHDPFFMSIKDIFGFYEGAVLLSPNRMKENLSRIPNDAPFRWIHHVGEQLIKELSAKPSNALGGTHDVVQKIKATVQSITHLTQSGSKSNEFKDEMIQFQRQMEEKLKELELVQIQPDGASREIAVALEEEPSSSPKATGWLTGMKSWLKGLSAFKESPSGSPPATQQPYLRIALLGETSAGKSTLLNSLFSTNIFFATQEEATGVPTEIYKGDKLKIEVWDKAGNLRERLVTSEEWTHSSGTFIKDEYLLRIQEFISIHTKVGSPMLNWVDRVKVYVPLPDLPEHVTLIDTPGFNANENRSTIAKQIAEGSHMSLFIMDARNALKGKELGILKMVREEVGRIFVVLNKMDLVFGDDELDCDGEDAAEETIERVRRDLSKSLGVEQVILYPVCSLPKDQVKRESWGYVDNLSQLIQKVFLEATDQQLDLIVDMLAKKSIGVSQKIMSSLDQELKNYENKLIKVQKNTPSNFEWFESEIRGKLQASLRKHRNAYVDYMTGSLDRNLSSSLDGFVAWLQTVSSASTLKNNVKEEAEKLTRLAISEIDNDRSRELNRMVSRVQEDIIQIFEELYSNLPFKTQVDPRQILQSLPGLKNAISGNLNNSLSSIDYGDGLNGGSAIGAIVGGALLGPLGILMGGFLGSLFGGKSLGDVKQEIYEAYFNAIKQLDQNIAEQCDRDLSTENLASFINGLDHITSQQIYAYRKTIEDEIHRQKQSISKLEGESIQMKWQASKMERVMEELQYWRIQRKAELGSLE